MDDPCASRHRGAETSVAAYDSIRESLTAARAEILRLIRESEPRGLSCWDASQMLDKPQNAISGRFTELAAMGLIVDSGERRSTGSGCSAKVWRIGGQRFKQTELF